MIVELNCWVWSGKEIVKKSPTKTTFIPGGLQEYPKAASLRNSITN